MNTTTAQQSAPSDAAIAQAMNEYIDANIARNPSIKTCSLPGTTWERIHERAREIDAAISAPAAAVGGDELEKVANDRRMYGIGFTVDGKRIDPARVSFSGATPAAPVGGFVVVPDSPEYSQAFADWWNQSPLSDAARFKEGSRDAAYAGWINAEWHHRDKLGFDPAAQPSAKDGVDDAMVERALDAFDEACKNDKKRMVSWLGHTRDDRLQIMRATLGAAIGREAGK